MIFDYGHGHGTNAIWRMQFDHRTRMDFWVRECVFSVLLWLFQRFPIPYLAHFARCNIRAESGRQAGKP